MSNDKPEAFARKPPEPTLLLDVPDDDQWAPRRLIARALIMFGITVLIAAIEALLIWVLWLTLKPAAFLIPWTALAPGIAIVAAVIWTSVKLQRRGHEQRFPSGLPITEVDARVRDARGRLLNSSLSTILLAKSLYRDGHAGLSIRIARQRDLIPIEPLEVPIEPMLISEDDPNFAALVPECLLPSQPRKPTGPALRATTTEEESRWHRYFIQRKGWVWLSLNVFMCFFYGLHALRTRQLGLAFPLWLALLIASLIPAFARGTPSFVAHNFIVPGGLLSRRGGRLTLLRRSESVLIADSIWRTQWNVIIFNGQAKARLQITDRELAVLLRAWLSPLQPPDIEQLSDLR